MQTDNPLANIEQIKHICGTLLSYDEDPTALQVLTNIFVYEALENDEEVNIHKITDTINLYIQDVIVQKMYNKNLIEIAIDENGKEYIDDSKLVKVFSDF